MSDEANSHPPTTIDRAILYEEVWTTPLRRLATKYGISDVALGKICRRLNVPRPGVGHWVRIEHGAKIERPPLPPLQAGQPQEATLAPHLSGGVRSTEAIERSESPPVVEMPATLAGAHPVALQLKRELATARPDNTYGGLLVIRGGQPAPVRVMRKTEVRLLRVASALFKALELRGHRVAFERERYKYSLGVQFTDLKVPIGVHEYLRQVPHVLTPEERASESRGGFSWAPKFDYHGTGLLQVVVGESWRRTTWKETAQNPIDTKLGVVVLRIEQAAANLLARQREGEALSRRLEEEDERRRRAELQRLHLRTLGQDLEQMSERAEMAGRIRVFLDAARRNMDAGEGSESARWLAWASAYADELDPLRHPERIAKVMISSTSSDSRD